MAIADRIPDLSDKELEQLRTNAVRLQASGSPAQRQQAEELLPLLGVALEERRLARAAAQSEARRANAKRKPAAAPAVEEKQP
jgi:hypothetical protein